MKEQREALKWQWMLAALAHEDDPTKFDCLQHLDFNDQPD